jgi:glycerol uptake facilitator-like aquaporin
MVDMRDVLPLIGEFLGTFLFLMSILVVGNPLVIGGVLALVIWLLSKTSGGHVNPAVSLAFYLKGSLSNMEYIGYMGAQFAAAIAALYTYKALV